MERVRAGTITDNKTIDDGADHVMERLAYLRSIGYVTPEGVVYDTWLCGPQGAGYCLYREPQHTKEHIERAKRYLRTSFDVVTLKVERVIMNSKEA